MRREKRVSFREIFESSKEEAAESAWEKAKRASVLRRLLAAKNRFGGASRCSEIKSAALKLVASLLPEQVQVSIDDDYQVGLVTVGWKGHGRFHLPADWSIEASAPSRSA